MQYGPFTHYPGCLWIEAFGHRFVINWVDCVPLFSVIKKPTETGRC